MESRRIIPKDRPWWSPIVWGVIAVASVTCGIAAAIIGHWDIGTFLLVVSFMARFEQWEEMNR